MLTGSAIISAHEDGEIIISPWSESNVNPNSYNAHIGSTLLIYDMCNNRCDSECPNYNKNSVIEDGYIENCISGKSSFLDSKKANPTITIPIPSSGYILEPGILYLANTIEYTESNEYLVCIDGRSSAARLGIGAHITAGNGSYGFKGVWTLEITVVHPVRIYPGMSICQFYFEELNGRKDMVYQGRYNMSESVTASIPDK